MNASYKAKYDFQRGVTDQQASEIVELRYKLNELINNCRNLAMHLRNQGKPIEASVLDQFAARYTHHIDIEELHTDDPLASKKPAFLDRWRAMWASRGQDQFPTFRGIATNISEFVRRSSK